MPTQSFADLGVSNAVIGSLSPVRASPSRSRSSASSSAMSSPDATCLRSRPPGRARRSPSGSRSSSGSPRMGRDRPPRSSRPPASSPSRSSRRSARSPTPARCGSPPSTAALGLLKQARDAARSHMLVATPGRLEDLLARRAFALERSACSSSTRPTGCSTWAFAPPSTGSSRLPASGARRCSSPPRSTARPAGWRSGTPATPRCTSTVPTARRAAAEVEHRFLPVTGDGRVEALVGELAASAT